MNTLHEQLNEALELWVALTGVDPMNRSFNLQSYHVQQTYEQLNEAQKLDPTGLTTAMLLRAFVEEWTLEATYSANDLLNRPGLVQSEIEKMRKVIAVLERPEVKEPTDEFLESLKKAVEHYEIDDQDTDELLNDQFEIAYLRRDAMQAIKNLSSHQFSRGEPSGDPIKYGKKIYQFWNVNSLIREIAGTPMSAVVLSLIRDPEAYHSYFVFAIRNGGNISVLTDKTTWDHPAQKGMQRRPDRKFAERAFRYHFPYNLMEFCLGGDDRIHIPRQEGLVRYNTEAIVLGKMNQVPAHSMVWLVMMLKLINDRYWVENDRAPALSYTGEMAVYPKALKEATTHLPVLRSKLLELPKLAAKDITHDRLIKTQGWARKPTAFNEWMVDRYGDQVPENVLNLVGDHDLFLLPSGEARELTKKEEKKREDDWHTELAGVERFRGLDPTEFGTRKQLVKDAEWTARYNQAKVVSELAKMEFERERDKVLKWFEDRVCKNKPKILHAVAAGEFRSVAQTMGGAFDMSKEVNENILRLVWRPDRSTVHHWGRTVIRFGEFDGRHGPMCCITGQRASVFGWMTPMVPQALAALAGCRVEDLPWGLQRYYVNEPYHGNSILNRLDPMDWVPKNPWKNLNLRVIVYLTKRAFNGLRKELGLPKFVSEDWEKIKDESDLW